MTDESKVIKYQASLITEKLATKYKINPPTDIRARWTDYHQRLASCNIRKHQHYIIGALSCVYERTVDEIADIVGINRNIIYSQLMAMTKKIRTYELESPSIQSTRLSVSDRALVCQFIEHLGKTNDRMPIVDKISGFYAKIKGGFKASSVDHKSRLYQEFLTEQLAQRNKKDKLEQSNEFYNTISNDDSVTKIIKLTKKQQAVFE